MEQFELKKIVPMNIIFPIKGSKVLLAIKTRKIGIGLFNGYGGKQEADQTMLQSCVEELIKEAGLLATEKDFTKIAEVNFFIHKNDGTVVLNKCDIFTVSNFSGEPKESEEMIRPTWFDIEHIPHNKMMEDAAFWVQRVINGERLNVEVHYNEERTKIIRSIYSKLLKIEET